MKRKRLELRHGTLFANEEKGDSKKRAFHQSNRIVRDSLNLGGTLTIPIVGGLFLGRFLDNRLSSSPILTLSFLFLGVIISFYTIYKIAKES